MKIIWVILISFIIFNSCTKPCEDLKGLESSFLAIYTFNLSSNNYFYPQDEFRSPFKKDSLQVINEDGRQFPNVRFLLKSDPRNTLEAFYAIIISPAFIIPDDNSAFDREKARKIYIKYSYNTTDTLTLVFKARKIKCDRSTYEYLKVFHRNNLIKTVADDIATDFTLNH
ncbi:MAG: hypothetical protein WKF85_05430 [Chitinophagaceae bacterium]